MHNQRIQQSRLLYVLFLVLFMNLPLCVAATERTITAAPPVEGTYYYTIQSGDTLWGIAAAHDITLQDLLALNGDLGDPKLLRPGQTVRVPGQIAMWPATASDQPTTTVSPAPPAVVMLPSEIAAWPAMLLDLINEKRMASGLSALTWSSELLIAAQAHAEDCAARNRGSHISSEGSTVRERLARAGYEATWASENWANAQNVAHAFRLWYDEPPGADPHRRNILHPRYTEIGIGVARGPWGYYFVADFGTR